MTTTADLETWENISRSRFVLKKFNNRGDLIDQMIGSRAKFHLSPQERRINTELAADGELDPFTNGMFAPIRILDSTEDAEQIASNPNLIGESEMVDLVKGRIDSLKKRLDEVQNPVVLSRLLEVAKVQDVPVSKLDAISARLTAVSPETHSEVEG